MSLLYRLCETLVWNEVEVCVPRLHALEWSLSPVHGAAESAPSLMTWRGTFMCRLCLSRTTHIIHSPLNARHLELTCAERIKRVLCPGTTFGVAVRARCVDMIDFGMRGKLPPVTFTASVPTIEEDTKLNKSGRTVLRPVTVTGGTTSPGGMHNRLSPSSANSPPQRPKSVAFRSTEGDSA